MDTTYVLYDHFGTPIKSFKGHYMDVNGGIVTISDVNRLTAVVISLALGQSVTVVR